MKRRNLFKMAGYGGVGIATAVQGNRSLAAIPEREKYTLPSFDFATVAVDRQGREQERTYHQARLYTEDLGNYLTLAMVSIPPGKF
ncbi:MAG: formylglycine-generating enzyme family protein, partial [Pleurocapsa sp.]